MALRRVEVTVSADICDSPQNFHNFHNKYAENASTTSKAAKAQEIAKSWLANRQVRVLMWLPQSGRKPRIRWYDFGGKKDRPKRCMITMG